MDANGCIGSDSIFVAPKTDCAEGLFVPTGFTPNGDGLNDQFIPLLFGNVQSFRFQIFNRWGEMIFQSTEPGKGWDGTYKGVQQDSNVFIWTCSYQLAGQGVEVKKGMVMLMK